jgi:hypothetical protein
MICVYLDQSAELFAVRVLDQRCVGCEARREATLCCEDCEHYEDHERHETYMGCECKRVVTLKVMQASGLQG